MSNEFINNINLNSVNSLTHLIDTISILDANEPTILTTGVFPYKLKIAKVKPLYKKMILLLIITDLFHFFLLSLKSLKK